MLGKVDMRNSRGKPRAERFERVIANLADLRNQCRLGMLSAIRGVAVEYNITPLTSAHLSDFLLIVLASKAFNKTTPKSAEDVLTVSPHPTSTSLPLTNGRPSEN